MCSRDLPMLGIYWLPASKEQDANGHRTWTGPSCADISQLSIVHMQVSTSPNYCKSLESASFLHYAQPGTLVTGTIHTCSWISSMLFK